MTGNGADGWWSHLQWLCEHAGIARVFPMGSRLGDPYTHSITFVVCERFEEPDGHGFLGRFELMGLDKPLSLSQVRSIKQAAHEAGWRMLITRVKRGRWRTVEQWTRHLR